MSLEHSPARQRKRARATHAFDDDDYRVMSFRAWCDLNGFSIPTGRRIIASGEGPPVLQLGLRRIGIRHGDNRRWQESRIRDGA
jgi:hypothetical protein